jgi:hypothetical protein
MIALGLLLSVALPLLAGVPWILQIERGREPGTWPIALAYGYMLGLLVAVSGMRILDAVHVPANLATVALLPLLVAVAGWWKNRTYPAAGRDAIGASIAAWRSMPRGTRIVFGIVVFLIALRLLTLGAEILFRPIFPWEAVSSVAAKGRVWFELGNMASYVSPQQWLDGAGNYTDADSGAFALPSLLLAFTAHMMTQWHEGAVAFPWWMLGLMMVLALYGHLRRAGAGIAFSMTFAYVFVSLPLVDLHIELAGAPQWIAATGVGLAGCAMLRWLDTRAREWLWFVAIGMAFALSTLISTWPWLVLFAAAAAIGRWPRHATKIAVGAPLIVLFGVLAWQQTPLSIGGRTWQLQVVPSWGETIESLFVLGNWHLLYGAAILVAIAGWRVIISDPWLPRTWLIAAGIGVLFVWGTVNVQGLWFGGLRDFSYAALQFAPMLVMWIALVGRAIALNDRDTASDAPSIA